MAARFLTAVETAELLGIRPQTLAVWRMRGWGPQYIRRGRSRRGPVAYEPSAVEEWLASHTYSSTEQERGRAALTP